MSDVKVGQAKRQRSRPFTVKTIQDYFNWRCSLGGYMSGLLTIIKKYAEDVNHITELGLRLGDSTHAFLAGKPQKMITYDFDRHCGSTYNLLKSFIDDKTEFVFICADVYKINIEETELLFVDCSPVYGNLKKVLAKHADKVKKYIMVHDTEHFGKIDQAGGKGLLVAINEFLNENKEWNFVEHHIETGGLTILERKI